METLLRKSAHLIHSKHKLIVFIFSVLTIVSIVMILNMKLTTDIIDVLPANNKVVIQFKDFMEKFSSLENLTILIEFDKKTLDEKIDVIDAIAKKLSESPLIEYVDYNALKLKGDFYFKYFPFYLDETGLDQLKQRLTPSGIEKQIRQNKQKLLSPFSSPIDNELISKDPLNISMIVKDSLMRTRGNRTMEMSTGYYLTKDNKMAFIFVKPKGKSKDMAFIKKLKSETDSIVNAVLKERDNPEGVKIGLAGTYIMAEEAREVILHDIISSFSLSVILIALLIWIVYRVRMVILLAIGFTLLSSLAMTLFFAYLMFGGLNIVTSIVAAVLIGLYVDYSMHIINRYGEELKKSMDPLTALEITLTKMGPAIIISALTTSLSFFSILVTRFEGLYELGLTSGIGVILCLMSGLFLLPSLLIFISRKNPDIAIPEKNVRVGIDGITTLVRKRPRQILAFSLIITIIAGAGLFRMSFDNNPERIGMKDSQSMLTSKKIAEATGKKGEPLIVIANAKNRADLSAEFDFLEEMFLKWKTDGLIKNYDSLGMFLPSPSRQKTVMDRVQDIKPKEIGKILTSSIEKNGFVYDSYINSYVSGITSALTNKKGIGIEDIETVADPRLGHFYNNDSLSLASYIYPEGKDRDGQTLDRLERDISSWSNLHRNLEPPALLGKDILFREIKSSILWGSSLAIIISLILNFIIVYFHFRNMKQVVLVMLPVTLGLLLTVGVMGYFRLSFNFINIGTIALISGFGVDYGIYMMQAYLKEDKRDVENALRISGKNIIMCAATTIAGCGSLVTARFAGIASIGVVLSIGAVSCSIIALLLLPAMLNLNSKQKGNVNA